MPEQGLVDLLFYIKHCNKNLNLRLCVYSNISCPRHLKGNVLTRPGLGPLEGDALSSKKTLQGFKTRDKEVAGRNEGERIFP